MIATKNEFTACRRCYPAIVIAAALIVSFFSSDVTAQDMQAENIDCRYWAAGGPPGQSSDGDGKGGWFPQDDIFRPLFADPRQPQFFMSHQKMRFRDLGRSINAGFVGAGETFGIWSSRSKTCDGLQLSVQGGIFAQFNLDGPSTDLINADYMVGLPISWRRGPFSIRARAYHQSSHLGDELLIHNPGLLRQRINLSFEEVESIVSWDHTWFRIYGGGGYLVHREPDLKRGKLQWGVEIRRPESPSPVFRHAVKDLRIVPLVGADFKNIEHLGWNLNANIVGGVEFVRPGSSRRVRLLLNYYYGYNPYGQFFNQKIQLIGGGVYVTF
jgi:hypothetical protein